MQAWCGFLISWHCGQTVRFGALRCLCVRRLSLRDLECLCFGFAIDLLLLFRFNDLLESGEGACFAFLPRGTAFAGLFVPVDAADRAEPLALRAMDRHHGDRQKQLFPDELPGLDFSAAIELRVQFGPAELMLRSHRPGALADQVEVHGRFPDGEGETLQAPAAL